MRGEKQITVRIPAGDATSQYMTMRGVGNVGPLPGGVGLKPGNTKEPSSEGRKLALVPFGVGVLVGIADTAWRDVALA